MSAAHDVHESTGIENRKLGMWAFLSSEFLLFGAFISNYLLFKGRLPSTDPLHPVNFYDIPFTSISSFVLLMSSLTMVMAHHALAEKDQVRARTWLLATAALGVTFLGGQFFEFSEFLANGAGLGVAPVWSSFFLLTGFHGTHVLVGVLMLVILFVISLRNDGLSEAQGLNLELVGLYWHFVDIIWIVIFTIIYLIP